MECIGTTTTLVLVNGSPTDEFPMERGLLQGDPLSPFLFFIVAEGLNVIMSFLVEANVFFQDIRSGAIILSKCLTFNLLMILLLWVRRVGVMFVPCELLLSFSKEFQV